jgi:mono/diheme cytochrome c family protein
MGTYVARASAPKAQSPSARRQLPWGLLTAALGVAAWLIVDPRTPDLAGQVYRANLFREAGFLVWDGRWYGGHDMPGYSLVFPPLAALVGVRAVGAAAVLTSAALFEQVAVRAYGPLARWGAVWFAVAALGDAWSGRITFALGVCVALGAVLALMHGRAAAAAILAGLCALCSPVAGVLLALAGLTYALAGQNGDASRRRVSTGFGRLPRTFVVLGGPPAVVVLALAVLFPEGGWEPYPLLSFLASVAVILGFLWALPAEQRLLRIGGVVYLAACVACVALHTPMGANVERYGVLLAGPLLVCALLMSGGVRTSSWVRSATTAAVLVGIAVWTVWGPVRETAAVAGNASTSASYYVPVERFVAAHGGSLVRVEVPFTRGHWEAAWLARRVSLARGWEKQLDERYDGVLLSKGLTAGQYRAWLDEQAVRYVALPDAPLDPSSAAEGRLVEAGLPYLREVAHTQHWRIYEVLDATPLAQGPGALSGMGHDWFSLRARAAGDFMVRVHYTRYWTVTAGAACVRRAPGGWTEVTARRGGAVSVAARFSIGRALGLEGASCRD